MPVVRLDHRPILGLAKPAPPKGLVVELVTGDSLTFTGRDGAQVSADEITVTVLDKTGHRARLRVLAPEHVKIVRNGSQ